MTEIIDLAKIQNTTQTKGPFEGSYGIRANEESFTIPFQLENKIYTIGSISFWLYFQEDCKSSLTNKSFDISANFENCVRFHITSTKSEILLDTFWKKVGQSSEKREWLPIPSLAQGWHHFALQWDSESGTKEGYLNGTAIFPDSLKFDPWEHSNPDTLTLTLSNQVHISELRFDNTNFKTSDLTKWIPKEHLNKTNSAMGLTDLGELSDESINKGTLLYENLFKDPSDIKDWVLEGKVGKVEIKEDGMHQWPEEGNWEWPEGHFVHWCPQDFPSNFIAEWEMEILNNQGLCIVFFGAKGSIGKDIFDPSLNDRKGHFGKYINGDIDCYHISYFAYDRVSTNLRRNPGFFLASNGPVGIKPSSQGIQKVTLLKKDREIVLSVNNRKCLEFTDNGERFGKAHTSGKIGFRQMYPAHTCFKSLRVWEL